MLQGNFVQRGGKTHLVRAHNFALAGERHLLPGQAHGFRQLFGGTAGGIFFMHMVFFVQGCLVPAVHTGGQFSQFRKIVHA